MNKYEQSFIKWFRKDGWMIRANGPEVKVWCADCDDTCRFKVTEGMIKRLLAEGVIHMIFPKDEPSWLDCYQLSDKYEYMRKDEFETAISKPVA